MRAASSAFRVVASAIALSAVLAACSGGDDNGGAVTAPKKAKKSSELVAFAADAPSDVTVDLGAAQVVRPVNGLLAGFDAKTPDDDLVKGIAPIQVRGWAKTVPLARVKALPARTVMLLSDSWGYPSENYPNGAGKAPFQDEVGWDTKVAEQLAAVVGRKDVLFEPWNEPDQKAYFAGTEEQFLRVWLLTYSAVRREMGTDAYMVGPSISSYDPARITRFLEFCLQRGCQVDVLSWHELVGEDADISRITSDLNDARTRFLANPRYARLGIKEINITEYGSEADQYRPGETVAYLQALEAGKADGAGRSCFSAPGGKSNCYNATLDGALAPKSRRPNGVWYVLDGYAAGLGGRVTSATTTTLSVVSSRPLAAGKPAYVLLGNGRRIGQSGATAKPVVEVRNLAQAPGFAAATKFKVEVREVKPSATGELGPSTLLTADVTATNGVLRFKVPDLAFHGAAIATITPLAS